MILFANVQLTMKKIVRLWSLINKNIKYILLKRRTRIIKDKDKDIDDVLNELLRIINGKDSTIILKDLN